MTDKPVIPKILIAEAPDAGAVARTLKLAFFDGDLVPWLVADPVERERIYPGYFEMLVEHALEHGTIEWTEDGYGVAIWYSVGDDPLPELPGSSSRLAELTRPYTARFVALDEAQKQQHPHSRRHHYLAYLGVHPHQQGCGYGGHLLRHHHEILDATRTPAFLEATGARNEALYTKHGYRPFKRPYPISKSGPLLYPMWREPGPFPTPGIGTRKD